MSDNDGYGNLIGTDGREMAVDDVRDLANSDSRGDNDLAGGEGVIAAAEREANAVRSDDAPLGTPGRPLDHRSPFMVGLLGALGVATTYAMVQLIATAREVLI